jgi:hypothetical protein
MYNVPWQNGRIYQTPIGTLSASFLLRPNTMFHPEGEWSARLVLAPLYAYRLRQMIAPAQADIVAKAKAMHENLPIEQQVNRPFKENQYWQAAAGEGGLETENMIFTFRLPTILREPTVRSQEASGTEVTTGAETATGKTERRSKRSKKGTETLEAGVIGRKTAKPLASMLSRGEAQVTPAPQIGLAAHGLKPEPILEVHTRVPLRDSYGQDMAGLNLEPDGWEASIGFSIHQYWLRSFGAGVTFRLHEVQLFGQPQRTSLGRGSPANGDEPDLPLPIAL